ncbi:PAS domain-containing protein [Sphingomonas humi]
MQNVIAAERLRDREESPNAGALGFLQDHGLPLSSVVLAFFDQSDDCIKLLDVDGALQFMNCNGMRAMEVDDFGLVAGCPWESLWPAETQGQIATSLAEASAGRFYRFEAFCPTAKGTPRWWDVTVTPVRDARGEVAAILCSSHDVTDRKVKQEALASVAAEMKHRLRNAYTVGAAVSMAMAKDQPQHREFANELATRLMHLAGAQSSLIEVRESTLASIIDNVLKGFGNVDAVEIGPLPDVKLDEEKSKAFALVLGELSTNSLKYGAMSGRGRVRITARTTEEGFEIDWSEDNDGETPLLDLSKVTGGTGSELMRRMLASVGGRMESTLSKGAFEARISVRSR